MQNITTSLDKNGQGAFYLEEEGKQLGEMVFEIQGNELAVFHTEVLSEFEGRGFAGKLLAAMVDYARQNHFKVKPLCPYVLAQFKRHPEMYHDLYTPEK